GRKVVVWHWRVVGGQCTRRDTKERGGAEDPWRGDGSSYKGSDRLVSKVATCPLVHRTTWSGMSAPVRRSCRVSTSQLGLRPSRYGRLSKPRRRERTRELRRLVIGSA